MHGPIHQIVFDFDGTLVDTMPSVIEGLGEAVRLATGNRPADGELLMSFGPAPQAVLEKWMPADKVPEALAHWLEFERSLGPRDIVPFAEVPELLAGLRKLGTPIGVFTGRDREATLRILRAHGWLDSIFAPTDLVCGDDGHAPKPAPDPLVHLMGTKGWRPATTLMVGDHPYDMIAGRAAGAKTAAALWDAPPGKTPRARYKAAWQKWDQIDCDLRLPTPLALLAWVRSVP